MTKIELAKQAVEAAKQRLAAVCSDNNAQRIQQFEKVWDESGTGSEQADRLEFVAKREQDRIEREYFAAKNGVLHTEMLLRVAKGE